MESRKSFISMVVIFSLFFGGILFLILRSAMAEKAPLKVVNDSFIYKLKSHLKKLDGITKGVEAKSVNSDKCILKIVKGINGRKKRKARDSSSEESDSDDSHSDTVISEKKAKKMNIPLYYCCFESDGNQGYYSLLCLFYPFMTSKTTHIYKKMFLEDLETKIFLREELESKREKAKMIVDSGILLNELKRHKLIDLLVYFRMFAQICYSETEKKLIRKNYVTNNIYEEFLKNTQFDFTDSINDIALEAIAISMDMRIEVFKISTSKKIERKIFGPNTEETLILINFMNMRYIPLVKKYRIYGIDKKKNSSNI